MGLPISVIEILDGHLYVPGYTANDAADRVRSRIGRGIGETHPDMLMVACEAGQGKALAETIDGLREEFIVCGSAGYPDPYAPTPNTLQEAIRFASEHSYNAVTKEPVSPVIRRRVYSDWETVET